MRIYHGQTSPNALEQCRQNAPSYDHGYEWTPHKMTPHDEPYILDNGAFVAYRDGDPWDPQTWLAAVHKAAESMPRQPEFAVLPDVVTDPDGTYDRSEKYKEQVDDRDELADLTWAFAVQDGMQTEEAVRFAADLGCEWIFVGGTPRWKRKYADRYVMTAHDYGLQCHIGRPNDLIWADHIGADSVDTTTIVRSGAYHKLQALESQTAVTSF